MYIIHATLYFVQKFVRLIYNKKYCFQETHYCKKQHNSMTCN